MFNFSANFYVFTFHKGLDLIIYMPLTSVGIYTKSPFRPQLLLPPWLYVLVMTPQITHHKNLKYHPSLIFYSFKAGFKLKFRLQKYGVECCKIPLGALMCETKF